MLTIRPKAAQPALAFQHRWLVARVKTLNSHTAKNLQFTRTSKHSKHKSSESEQHEKGRLFCAPGITSQTAQQWHIFHCFFLQRIRAMREKEALLSNGDHFANRPAMTQFERTTSAYIESVDSLNESFSPGGEPGSATPTSPLSSAGKVGSSPLSSPLGREGIARLPSTGSGALCHRTASTGSVSGIQVRLFFSFSLRLL